MRLITSWAILWLTGLSLCPRLTAHGAASPPLPAACDDRLAALPAPEVTLGPFEAFHGYRRAALRFPTPRPSGIAPNDTVQADLYLPPVSPSAVRRPAVLVLHNLLAVADARFERNLAASLAQHGFVAVFMDLPFHRRRTPPGVANGALFVRGDLDATLANVKQAISDAAALVRWLGERPDVDPKRIGVVGVSIGGFLAHLLMGEDSRIRSGVTFVAGGDVAGLLWKSIAGVAQSARRVLQRAGITRDETERRLAKVEPTRYADCNAPRSILMVNGTEDLIVPRSCATAMIRALHNPATLWLPTNHFGIVLLPDRLYRLTRDFLGEELAGRRFPRSRLKAYQIPALKAAVYTGLESRLTAGLALERPLLYTARNRPWLSAWAGWTGRGPFVGLAAPVHQGVAAGAAWRPDHGFRRASAFLSGALAF